MNIDDIKRLENLDASATKGPWMVGVSLDANSGNWPCFRLRDLHDPTDKNEIEANRTLIEGSRNALPALLRIARAAVEFVEAHGSDHDASDIRNAKDRLFAAIRAGDAGREGHRGQP